VNCGARTWSQVGLAKEDRARGHEGSPRRARTRDCVPVTGQAEHSGQRSTADSGAQHSGTVQYSHDIAAVVSSVAVVALVVVVVAVAVALAGQDGRTHRPTQRLVASIRDCCVDARRRVAAEVVPPDRGGCP
jgi:hypothetical protein